MKVVKSLIDFKNSQFQKRLEMKQSDSKDVQNPKDKYSKSEAEVNSMFETNEAKKLYANFVMPLILMTSRYMIEYIFRLSYQKFYKNIGPSGNEQRNESEYEEPPHVLKAQRKINGFISEILDSNLYYSRISFLESGKDALDIKNQLLKGKHIGFSKYKLPSIAASYFTRSSLIQNLFETPSEGHLRAKFSDFKKKFNNELIKDIKVRNLRNDLMS